MATVVHYTVSDDKHVALNNTVNCCQHTLFLWLYYIQIAPQLLMSHDYQSRSEPIVNMWLHGARAPKSLVVQYFRYCREYFTSKFNLYG